MAFAGAVGRLSVLFVGALALALTMCGGSDTDAGAARRQREDE